MTASVNDGVEPVPAPSPDTAPASAGAPGASLAKWQFRPGQSGNPSGRPKGIVQAVQKRAGRDGKKLITDLWMLCHGTPSEREAHFGEKVRVDTRDRLTALGMLLDRGWGRPATLIGLESGPSLLALLTEVTARPAAPVVSEGTDDDPA